MLGTPRGELRLTFLILFADLQASAAYRKPTPGLVSMY